MTEKRTTELQFRTAFLSELWRRLGVNHRRAALYGAGKHTSYFMQEVASRCPTGPKVCAIIDDAPKQTAMFGIPIVSPNEKLTNTDLIFISSDRCADLLHKKACLIWGNVISTIINPYCKIDPGPYESCPPRLPSPQELDALEAYKENPHVLIEITSVCNFSCDYCRHPDMERSKKHMPMEMFVKIIDELPQLTDRKVILDISGEPTLHPDFYKMAQRLNNKGLAARIFTNASNLDPSMHRIAGDQVLSISLTAEDLRRRSPYSDYHSYISRIQQHSRQWLSASDAKSDLILSFLYNTASANREYTDFEWMKYREYVQSFVAESGLGPRECRINQESKYHLYYKAPHGKRLAVIFSPILYNGPYAPESKQEQHYATEYGFCDFPWKLLAVRSDGEVGHCCKALDDCCAFTSPEDPKKWTSLKDLWLNDSRINRIRRNFREGNVLPAACKRCLTYAPGGVYKHSLGFDPFRSFER